MKRPNTCVNLIKAINTIAKGGDPVRLSRAMANVIVGQFLPDGAVKGGSSLMFRYGGAITRYTRDVDVARKLELDEYLRRMEELLAQGWNGFAGMLVKVEPPNPKGVPSKYVMLPYDIKLSYMGRPWQTVRIEVGHNEIGDADESELALPSELAAAFEQLDFPVPKPVPVMGIAHQIAQKLHAVSEANSERAHDLIDLQLMVAQSNLDWADVKSKCVRLFGYRRMQAWPPTVVPGADWARIYKTALDTMHDKAGILENAALATTWVNSFIRQIQSA